jgi:hypothetical protein
MQVIPTAKELVPFESMMEDSLAEDRHSPVPGLVHRYPDRVLMLVTTQCASYCRYCTRSRIVGDPAAQFKPSEHDAQIDYIARTPQVRDVLLSGGDPLTLAPKVLENLIARLRAIPHVEIIRIGSRVPVFMPLRGHTSGYAVPHYIIDAPGGGGKVPITPNYLLSSSDVRAVLRNFEGFITTYEQPAPGEYTPHDSKNCKYCQSKRPEPGQEGLTRLLDGEEMFIKPENFDSAHTRGGGEHRLNVDEAKWKPLGIGSETQPVITVGEPVAVVNGEVL